MVELIAEDTNNCQKSLLRQVIVDSLPSPGFVYSDASCGDPVQFTDISSDGGAPINGWNWNFGDISSGTNNTSTFQNPEHVYGL